MKIKLLENEAYLLNQLAIGDESAFCTLYNNHKDKLFFYIFRITDSKQVAEDVLQEVFVKIWLDREKARDIRNFGAWLFTLARNKTINGLRRMSLETVILSEIGQKEEDLVNDINETVDFRETTRALQLAIEQLPSQQKLVFRLRREAGLKNDEIATQLQISPLTVKKHMSQAYRSIRRLLENQEGISITILSAILCYLSSLPVFF